MLKGVHILLSFLLLLSGCKLTLVTETGGSIISESGSYNCGGGSSCELGLPEGAFADTFTAVPDEGFRFAGWSGLCGEGLNPTTLNCSVSVPEQLRDLDIDGELVARFSDQIVGTWLTGSFDDPDNMALVTSYKSGYTVVARSALDDPSATNPTGGFSYFTYTYDRSVSANALTSNLDAQILQNSIGQYSGFVADPFGNLTFYYKGAAPSEDSITYTIRNRFGGGEDTYQRIKFGDNRESLEGTWTIGDIADYENFSQITFYNGFFMVVEYCESNGDRVGGGLQRGTYIWDSNSGALSVMVLHDTLEGCGLYDVVEDRPRVQFVKKRGGSALVFSDGEVDRVAQALR